MNYITNLEKKLSKYFNRKFCVLTGNGTTAMYLYFKLLKKKSVILFPSITCVQAVNSAIFAGHKVLFSDVSLNDYNIDFQNFIKIEKKKKLDVVVPTHIFGHTLNIKKITDFCKKKNIHVLEDATQAMGGTFKNKKIGSFGNASIISFGYSKILDCGGGGGILTDDKEIYKKIKMIVQKLPFRTKKNLITFERYKKYYYRSDKNTPNKKKFVKKIFTYQKKIKDHLLFKIDKTTTKKINYKFSKIKNILSKRHQNHRLYDKYLDKKNIIFPKLQDGSVSWRFCFLLKNKRDEFVQYLRSKNIDVSTWYPSLHYLKKYKSSDFKKAIKIDTSIINLWTDEKKRISVLKKDIQVINNFFKP